MIKEPKQVIKMLHEALKAASDHLDYCGYGDNWERECALKGDDPLDKKIEEALAVGESFLKSAVPVTSTK